MISSRSGGGPLLADIGGKRESNDKYADVVVLRSTRVVQTPLQLLNYNKKKR